MYITVHSQSFLEELVLSESRSDLLSVRILKTRGAFTASSMKPLPIAILLTAILLTTHLPLLECRARGLRVVDDRGFKQQLDEVLLQAEDSAVSYLLGAKLLQYLQQRKPEAHRSATFIQPISAGLGLRPGQGLGPGLGAEAPEKGRWREDEDASQEELVGFSKRNEEPPISIDLTFHLLRNMIEMARIENQREQAELNRKYLDEVGK
ncbi:urocortin [Astyanax mexicanus]|uniref:Urocortin n=2 Tax=Astyanax mexicanus TaxID=7994 RepID=A0A8T2MGJ0_ASTMX|nr:urocortin [Astyanax mexicanus]